MSSTSRSVPLGTHAQARSHAEHFVRALLRRATTFMDRLRKAAEERRTRKHLATLPDHLLRDIGIAEDEIHRIRACERFTPRAWAERMGERHLFDL